MGLGLPLVGYGASIACLARRERAVNQFLQELVTRYEAKPRNSIGLELVSSYHSAILKAI